MAYGVYTGTRFDSNDGLVCELHEAEIGPEGALKFTSSLTKIGVIRLVLQFKKLAMKNGYILGQESDTRPFNSPSKPSLLFIDEIQTI